MLLKKKLLSAQKRHVRTGCQTNVIKKMGASSCIHGFMGIGFRHWQSSRGTYRLSLGLLFHQDLTSFSRVVVMEQYMFGIAILVNQQE
ncbi:hypothetical protein P3X46_028174 [Hevea brasiliensis]|uniref:Uncharacterized protein n=1 Tax=Hevea brasiliensis TaxID=3981 RepID=A0ABQ9KN65_HEVBR|nr:hypothetical protein P3X46_028174 [Hevea brasiliensis]